MTEQPSEAKKSYPYMSPGTWGAICLRLRRNIPKSMDTDWLQSVLNVSKGSARNLLPQLKTMGLVEPDGTINTELVTDLRDASTYANACSRIVSAVYPPSLLDAFPEPSSENDSEGVRSWFMRNAGVGESMGGYQARLFFALTKAESPTPEDAPKPRARKSTAKKAETAGTKKAAASEAKTPESDPAKTVHESTTGKVNSSRPNLHIDLQIHISADASAEQIDAVFSSMAKHLYPDG